MVSTLQPTGAIPTEDSVKLVSVFRCFSDYLPLALLGRQPAALASLLHPFFLELSSPDIAPRSVSFEQAFVVILHLA
jgi:hypothetical protein